MTTTPPSPPPPGPPQRPSTRVEIVLSHLLRGGVILSMLIMLAGLTLRLVHHPQDIRTGENLPGLVGPKAQFPHTVQQVLGDLEGLSARAIAALGLLVLIATPVVRVAASVVAFTIERDWTYVALTLLVLILLLISFATGKAG